jgi:putative ribosome biogenesis GTPase RsgA
MPRAGKAKTKVKAKVKKVKKVEKIKPEPHPLEAFVGDLVSYYDEGWRYGYLEAIEKNKTARIKPIAGYKVKVIRCVRTSVEDVKLINCERR